MDEIYGIFLRSIRDIVLLGSFYMGSKKSRMEFLERYLHINSFC